MTDEQFADYLPRYQGVIEALARKRARRDAELFDELVQVGRIALWELDPALATSNEDAWIRQALFNKMTDALRKESPMVDGVPRFESLQPHLARGDQVTVDPQTGEARLLHAPARPLRDPGGQPARETSDDEWGNGTGFGL